MIDPEYKHLCGLQARLLTFRKLQKHCGHMDGWKSLPWSELRGFMQCMTCGLVAPEAELRKLERWVDEDDYLEWPTALEYELTKWTGGASWMTKK